MWETHVHTSIAAVTGLNAESPQTTQQAEVIIIYLSFVTSLQDIFVKIAACAIKNYNPFTEVFVS